MGREEAWEREGDVDRERDGMGEIGRGGRRE